jgi:hypothetical protein
MRRNCNWHHLAPQTVSSKCKLLSTKAAHNHNGTYVQIWSVMYLTDDMIAFDSCNPAAQTALISHNRAQDYLPEE